MPLRLYALCMSRFFPSEAAGGQRRRRHKPVSMLLAAATLVCACGALAQTVQTIAGGRLSADGPDNGFVDGDSLALSQFDTPLGCAFNAAGNLLVADNKNGAVRRLDLPNNKTYTILTNLNQPVGVALDVGQNLFVIDAGGGGRILKYAPVDSLHQHPTTIVSGLGSPTAFTLDGNGNAYVTDLAGSVRFVNATNGAVGLIYSGLKQPRGIALLSTGMLVVADTGNHVLRIIDPRTGLAVGRIGSGQAGYLDGAGDVAQFNQPYQVARGPYNNLIVTDFLNHRVRKVNPDGVVTTVYGVDPNLWEGPCTSCNPVILPGWFDGVNGQAGTAEAREPAGVVIDTAGTVYTTEIYYHILRRVTGVNFGDAPSTNVVVLDPVVDPLSGYFPTGVDIQVRNLNIDPEFQSEVYYTTDGSEPGPNNPRSFVVDLVNGVGVIHWRDGIRDLSSLRIKAFVGATPGSTVSGHLPTVNEVGVPADIGAGAGATALVPIVANLRTNQTLKSLQFLVQLTAVGSAPPITGQVRAVGMSPGDFVPVVAATTNMPITRTEIAGSKVLMEVAYLGTNAGFNVKDFSTVALLAVPVPAGAKAGDQYTIVVGAPSGSSDASGSEIYLGAMPAHAITVSTVSYLVGDTAPAGWYGAGTFGDGQLRNTDVNNAFYASLGLRVPPSFSDVFDAMDTFPEDTLAAVGGDGRIRFLDWQILLDRSVGLRTNNWRRIWTSGGIRVATPAPSGGLAALLAASTDVSGPIQVEITPVQWQAALVAESQARVRPGDDVVVPIFAQVASGASLAGLQFRAEVLPQGGAPPLERAVRFTQAVGLPSSRPVEGLPDDQVAAAWSSLPALTGRTLLGTLKLAVPESAAQGQSYEVRFLNADGAPDLSTQYDVEGRSGYVSVLEAAPVGGASSFRLRWAGMAGRTYFVESTVSLANPRWTVEAANLAGRGRVLEHIDRNTSGGAKFYRVGVLP